MIVDVTYNSVYDVAYWQAERFLVQIQGTLTGAVTVTLYDEAVVVAKYTPDASGSVLIDVTDYVRAFPEHNRLTLQWGQTGRNVTFYIAGRINPAGVLIPAHPLRDAQTPAPIVPPQKMLIVEGLGVVMAEFYSPDAEQWSIQGDARWTNNRRNLRGFDTIGFSLSDGSTTQDFRPELVDACKPYAIVMWESFTGAKRRHVFYIVKQTNETGDVVALENLQNEWMEFKGETDGFSLRLEELTRYDLWYYSDIITSSDVRVSIDGWDTFYRVQVNDKKYTIPETDEGKLSTLEIPIKFRKYDTI